jgi:hypothetical protein
MNSTKEGYGTFAAKNNLAHESDIEKIEISKKS